MPRLLALLVVAALLVSACAADLPMDATGEQIFSHSCAPCHGRNLQGRSGPPLGGDDPPSLGEERAYFVNTVTKGRSRMPSFESLLSADQIDRVVDFVISRQDR